MVHEKTDFCQNRLQNAKKALKMSLDVKGVARKEKNRIMGNVMDFKICYLK